MLRCNPNEVLIVQRSVEPYSQPDAYDDPGKRLPRFTGDCGVQGENISDDLTSPVRNHRLLLACLLPAKRNQQETCQKSRRDGDLLDWPVRILEY